MNDKCLQCKSKSVCKVMDIIKELSDVVTLKVDQCLVNNDFTEEIGDGTPNLAGPQPVRAYQNFRELKKATDGPMVMDGPKIESDKPKIKIIQSKEQSKIELEECPTCHTIVPKNEIIECQCGTRICETCGTFDAESKSLVCENCWEEE